MFWPSFFFITTMLLDVNIISPQINTKITHIHLKSTNKPIQAWLDLKDKQRIID